MDTLKRLVALLCVALPLVACQAGTNETNGTLIGAGGGAIAGGAIGALAGRNAASALIGAGLGALAGGIAGNLIGRSLDERDRQRATLATQQVLMAPVTYSSNPRVPPRPPARPARWESDHSGASGSAAVTAVQPQPNGGECRNVREIAVIQGKEVTQNSRYCRNASGEWASA